jgi:hypothetical protein
MLNIKKIEAMKTNNSNKKFTLLLLIAVVISSVTLASNATQKDSIPFSVYKGKLIDKDTQEPVIFATVYVLNSSVGNSNQQRWCLFN